MSLAHHAIANALLLVVLTASAGAAGQAPPPPMAAHPPAPAIFGPPPPVAPAVISRDAEGHATVRAVRTSTPLRVDGHLDEEVYDEVPFISDFIQNDPDPGAPATERTDIWVLFDDEYIYFTCRCWESRPDRLVANEMRRDNTGIVRNDQIGWSFDTFYDRRNMVLFEVGAAGGRLDGQVTNERQINLDWNPIWYVRTSRFQDGYIVEAAIPFRSLRFNRGDTQIWGLQVRRHNQSKNERSYLTRVPASVAGQGHFRASLAATLVGLEVPAGFRNLDIKPFVTSSLTTDRLAQPAISNEADGAIGLDVKYGLTRSVALDLTVNTDFAQVEADEQQVNLTRFNLFFPEKRDFFLENAGVFAFANVATSGAQAGANDTPVVFYSRQIGLVQGRQVPIRAGGRLTGRAGPFTLGVLNVQTGADRVSSTPSTNFSVMRLTRDILGNSSVGAIYTGRSAGVTGTPANHTVGVDGSFSFGPDLAISSYWAQSHTSGVSGQTASYRGFLDYNADRYGVQAEHLFVGRQFTPEMGFVKRRDMRKNAGTLRFSPRPRNDAVVRKYWYAGSFTHIEDGAGRLETRTLDGLFEIQLQNSDRFFLGYTDQHEFLPRPFPLTAGVTLPPGGYDFGSGRLGYSFGGQRRLSGNVSLDYGTFYDGDKLTFTVGSGRVNVGRQLSIEPGVSLNRIDVGPGRFTATVLTSRVTYTMTPLMFTSALLQYNSGTKSIAANVRFRWEYRPGSEMFLVYNEQRDTLASSLHGLQNRALIFKINRVFRY